MYNFKLKFFYLILYSGDCRTFVGNEIYYLLYLAIIGFTVKESYYIPERLFRFLEYDEMVIWSSENVGVLVSKSYNQTIELPIFLIHILMVHSFSFWWTTDSTQCFINSFQFNIE
jgi:hypothetical protein